MLEKIRWTNVWKKKYRMEGRERYVGEDKMDQRLEEEV